MKILVIRGENLASIAGRFEVLLDQPPLVNAGLFAITGPTGAGKSTLLDAMCLALFDQMPRFDGRGGALIGRPDDDEKARLPSRDVRSVLRRGAGQGFAEVEYLGRGGARYRARWSVHRAREKAHGVFQFQRMSLIDIATGQSLGRTRSEVLSKIEETLGLTYEQFRRSALLAQGDFAAFLRASEQDRSNLLEQMTGTALYTRLSIAAHETCREMREEVRTLEIELGSLQVLAAEERARLEERIAQHTRERAEAEELVAHVDHAQRWFARRRELVRLETAAVAEEQAASSALAGDDPLRGELAHVERAHRVKPLLEAARDAEGARARANTQREDLAAKALASRQRRDDAAEQRASFEEAHRRARETLEHARPTLEAAAKLDVDVAQAERRLAEAAERAREAGESLAAASTQSAQVEELIAAARRSLDEVNTWMAANPALEPLAAQWPRWEQEIKRYAAALRRERETIEARTRAEVELSRATQGVEAARTHAREAEEARLAAEEGARAAEEVAHRHAMTEAIRDEREALLARRDRLQPLEAWITQALHEEDVERVEGEREAERRAHARTASETAQAAAARWQSLLLQQREASQALQQTRARQDLASYRAALRSGDPCPLCGATEHPYAAEKALFAGLVGDLEAREKALQDDLLAAQRAESAARTQAAAYEAQAGESAARAQRAREVLGRAREQWARATGKLGLEAPAPDAHGREVLRSEGAAIEARLEAIKVLERRAAELAAEAVRRREDAATRRKAEAQAQKAREAAEKTAAEVARRVEKLASELEHAGAERELAGRELAAPLAGWRPEWRKEVEADARRFEASCRDAVKEHQERASEHEQLAKYALQLAAQREAAAALEKERREHAQELARERAEKAQALSTLREKRGGILGGRPTAEVRGALERQVNLCLDALERARAAEQECGEQAASAETAARMAAQLAEERADAAQRATAALAARLAEEGVDRGAVEAHLARDAEWIKATRRRLEEHERAAAKTRAVLEERTRARAEHDGSGAPSLTEEEAAAKRTEADAAKAQAITQHAAAGAALQRDDLARSEQEGKLHLLHERRALAARWGKMDELIGSSDGKKFRIFAQSLTLDALLSYANEHLEELAPRYRLMRVPDHDLDLQILDRDMADEIRSVNSLSGGESFLVSLALALGLSSLSARDVRVETLFIDEGLAALDPKTLDSAIASLDVLQASGRQVGLISHVVALAEQIGTEVRVEPLGGGRSRVVVAAVSEPGQAPAAPAPGVGAPKKRTKKK